MYLKQALPVITAILLFSLVLAFMNLSDTLLDLLRLDVVVIKLRLQPDLREKAYVFVSLVYPEGLRQVSKAVVNPEKVLPEVVVLNLKDLRRAWREELGKTGAFAEPSIVVTGFTRSGRVFVHGVELFWKELPKSVELVLTPLVGINVTGEQEEPVGSVPVEVDLEALDGCRVARYRVDEYDWTAPTVVMKVTPDSSTWGAIVYHYIGLSRVGFRVSVFIESQWTSAGLFIVGKNSVGDHPGFFTKGREYYIWMNFTYRYEKWRVCGRCGLVVIDYYEEYIYINNFYPETIDGGPTPPNTRLPPIDSWIYEGRYNATSLYVGYYHRLCFDYNLTSFAIDAVKFIDVLSLLGKISSKAAAEANTIGLVVSVNFVYNNEHSFCFHVWFYSYPETVHSVYRAVTVDYQSVPVLHFLSFHEG